MRSAHSPRVRRSSPTLDRMWRLLTLLALTVTSAFAADDDCTHGYTNSCAHSQQIRVGDEVRAADAELNRTYRQVMAALQAERRALLRSEQRKWLEEVRDKGCAKRIEEEWGGSCPTTWCIIAEQECIRDETRNRTLDLRKLRGAR